MMRSHQRLLWVGLFALGCAFGQRSLQAQTAGSAAPTEPAKEAGNAPLQLDEFTVTASADEDFDDTGMGSVEQEMSDEPFANDLVNADDFSLEGDDAEMATELTEVAESSPANRIAGEDRLKLRGFPTPLLRNGFIQVGMPETLNVARTIIIQGPLVPVLGRAAPGGIQNLMTARPRSKPQTRWFTSVSSRDRQRMSLEFNSPVVARKLWQRIAVDWQQQRGPEQFASGETKSASAAFTWKHSRKASTLLALDFRQINSQASPGIPEYRVDADHLIAGPYLPLADFNANGPAAGVRRRSEAVTLQFDGQPNPRLAIRASLDAWSRTVEQDRFTQSVLNLSTGLFEGLREPRHLDMPQRALALRLESTLRFRAWGGEHKLLASTSGTMGRYLREERSLAKAIRDALPPDVLHFDPSAPNYALPAFSLAAYSRINTERFERARYTSVELSDRVAWWRGRLVMTAGLRLDRVDRRVDDRKPGAFRPEVHDRTQQVSYHGGLNYQLSPSRLLAFASVSTAFDPSTPVDARTGRIQDNETTLGYETGLRGRLYHGQLDYTVAGFLLYNRHIAHRNPLYNDPIADADQTQPQLVAAGEERFEGGRMQLKWTFNKTLQLHWKGSYTHAITTASPDLPQEVGRPIARLPALSLSTNLRHRPAPGRSGFTWAAGWQYLSAYVVRYADLRHDHLAYPGYGLASVSTGYQWRRGKLQIEFEASCRNAFDRDLLASNARVDAGREIIISSRLAF